MYNNKRRRIMMPRMEGPGYRQLSHEVGLTSCVEKTKNNVTFTWTSETVATSTNAETSDKKHLFILGNMLRVIDHTNITQPKQYAIQGGYVRLSAMIRNQTLETVYVRFITVWDKYWGFPTKPALQSVVKYDSQLFNADNEIITGGSTNPFMPYSKDFWKGPSINRPLVFNDEEVDFCNVHTKYINLERYKVVYNKVVKVEAKQYNQDLLDYTKQTPASFDNIKSFSTNIPINRKLFYRGFLHTDNKYEEYCSNGRLLTFCFIATADQSGDGHTFDSLEINKDDGDVDLIPLTLEVKMDSTFEYRVMSDVVPTGNE